MFPWRSGEPHADGRTIHSGGRLAYNCASSSGVFA
jgi:hypothetical protein